MNPFQMTIREYGLLRSRFKEGPAIALAVDSWTQSPVIDDPGDFIRYNVIRCGWPSWKIKDIPRSLSPRVLRQVRDTGGCVCLSAGGNDIVSLLGKLFSLPLKDRMEVLIALGAKLEEHIRRILRIAPVPILVSSYDYPDVSAAVGISIDDEFLPIYDGVVRGKEVFKGLSDRDVNAGLRDIMNRWMDVLKQIEGRNDNVRVVNMLGVLGPGDRLGNMHPNASGSRKLARIWEQEIARVLK